jgi:hypothetical protein
MRALAANPDRPAKLNRPPTALLVFLPISRAAVAAMFHVKR